MSTYVVTGSASGMGQQVVARLTSAGHSVIGVDLKDADVVADLSTPDGRRAAAAAVLERAGGALDGAVLAAGLGPHAGREALIAQVNYFGVVDLLEAWRPALAAAGGARVVVFSSNSSTTVPLVPKKTIRAFLAGDAAAAIAATRRFKANAAAMVYAGSKIAVSRWLRRTAVRPEWADAGIRLNAIAPGAILTPMLQGQLDDPDQRGAIEAFPIPVGHFGDAGQIADWVVFLLGPAAEFMTGAIVFVDGGTDAYFRADDWPTAVPFRGLRRYLRLSKAYAARRAAA